MIRATSIAAADEENTAADTITLDEWARHRRRMVMVSDGGIEFLLDLPEARLLRHGEGLVLDDGRIVEVRATPEELLEVRGDDHRHLLALAWQIGNRHLAAQIEPERILIRRDHVIAEMLGGLGASVSEVEEGFDPEGGAYGDRAHDHHHGEGGGEDEPHSHDHGGDHSHHHAHGHPHHHHHSPSGGTSERS